jgi:hypothetical protein
VVGTVERRGSRYFVHVRLRQGASGDFVAEVELVVRSGKLSKSDLGEVKEQIIGAFDNLPEPGETDDGEDEPVAKGKGKGKGKHVADADDSGDDEAAADEDDEPKAKAKGKGKDKGKGKHKLSDDDEASADDASADDAKHRAFRGRPKDKDEDAAADDDDDGKAKAKGKGKDADDEGDGERVATRDDATDESADAEMIGSGAETAGDPRRHPIEALVGASITGRNLSFTTTAGLTNKPQGYKSGVPVGGLFIDASLYPLAFNKKNRSILRDFGINVMFDRVLSISSQLKYKDGAGADQVATLGTTEQRLAVGLVFRFPLGDAPTSATILASVRYNRSKFVIAKDQAPMGVIVDIPNTDYTYVDPGLALRYPLSAKLALDGGLRFLFITNTGEMQQPEQYGAATVIGFDVDAGGDYMLNRSWFLHAGLHLESIGFSFKGNGDLTSKRDGDATTIDVSAARDTYYGAMLTAGYLY